MLLIQENNYTKRRRQCQEKRGEVPFMFFTTLGETAKDYLSHNQGKRESARLNLKSAVCDGNIK